MPQCCCRAALSIIYMPHQFAFLTFDLPLTQIVHSASHSLLNCLIKFRSFLQLVFFWLCEPHLFQCSVCSMWGRQHHTTKRGSPPPYKKEAKTIRKMLQLGYKYTFEHCLALQLFFSWPSSSNSLQVSECLLSSRIWPLGGAVAPHGYLSKEKHQTNNATNHAACPTPPRPKNKFVCRVFSALCAP